MFVNEITCFIYTKTPEVKIMFIIYQIYIAAGLYFDFISKYNKLEKKNLYINTPLLYSIIYGYFYLYFSHCYGSM